MDDDMIKKIAALIILTLSSTACAPVLKDNNLLEMEELRLDNAKSQSQAMVDQINALKGLEHDAQIAGIIGSYMLRQAEILTQDKTTGYTYALAADKARNQAAVDVVKSVGTTVMGTTGVIAGALMIDNIRNKTNTIRTETVVPVEPTVIQVPMASP